MSLFPKQMEYPFNFTHFKFFFFLCVKKETAELTYYEAQWDNNETSTATVFKKLVPRIKSQILFSIIMQKCLMAV